MHYLEQITGLFPRHAVTESSCAPAWYRAKAIAVEQDYWLRRKRESLANARIAAGAEARLIHFELAGRYSVRAADSGLDCPITAP